MNKLKSVKEVWEKYSYILTPSQKRWGVVVLIMTLIGAVCETLGVSIILPLVQVMIAPQQLRENELMFPVINMLNLNSNESLIWAIGIIVIIVYLGKNLFLVLLSYVRIKYACKVQRELSIKMMKSYMKKGYVFFTTVGTGELIRGMRDSVESTYFALYQLFRVLAEIMTIAFICIYIMFTDIVMALCVVGLAILCLGIVMLICQKQVKKCGEINYEYSALINKELLQTFQGIKEVLVMRRQEYFVGAYREKHAMQQKGIVGQTVASESPAYLIEAVCVAGLIVAVCLKAVKSGDTSVLVPQLAAFAVAAFRILPSLGRISNYFNQFIFCVPGVNDTYDNLKKVDFTENDKIFIENKERNVGKRKFSSSIKIDGITWKYPNADKNVLENISLEIKKGQSVAFIGKSGAGKTTLADVVLGLLVPQKGNVKFDGINAMEMVEQRANMIGFVPQVVNLLDDTIRRNIAFGINDTEIDDDKVWRALEQAQLKEIIEDCDKGLDTEIGERGLRFSGGQRQRLAIARALYMDPDILVLDEATSALDSETENAVMEAITALHGKKTMIIIAHRLTTIKNCDIIYEIVDGKAVEKTYEEIVQ